ncbi:MAG: GNAT family N-acetyltransferase [Candidatus Methanomethylicaceae archaeon]
MVIREAKKTDLHKIVDIHIKAFPGFFMTKLGKGFLREYYFTVLAYNLNIFLVAEDENENRVVAFVAGFLKPSSFYLFLKKRCLKLALAIFLEILKSPGLISRVIQNYQRVNKNISQNEEKTVELASIAVDPEYSGKGIGKSLVNKFLSAALALGAEKVILSTDAENNDKVNYFYKSLGFKLERTFYSNPGRLMNEYCFYLNDRSKT